MSADSGATLRHVVERIHPHDLGVAQAHFPSPEMKAYYFAHVIETHVCWPRVLAGTMEQDRFHERTKRMTAAFLGATT